MPAKKSSKKKTKSTPSAKRLTAWEKYCRDRDEFYVKHPWSKMLMGLLIISYAIAIGLLIYNKNRIFIGLSLDQEGIDYPYVEPLYAKSLK